MEDELADAGYKSLSHFLLDCQSGTAPESLGRRPSAPLFAPKTRPLADKLADLLAVVKGRMVVVTESPDEDAMFKKLRKAVSKAP